MRSDRPLRVHLIHQGFADYVGGLIDGLVRPERVLGDDTGSALRQAVDLRVTTLQSGRSAGVELGDVPVPHQSITLPRFRDPRSFPQALIAVRKVLAEPCDVIHWQAAGNPWVDAAFALQMRGRPSVVTVHDMQAHPGDRNTLPGTFRAIASVARQAQRVIVHSPHVVGQGVAAGISADRLRVLAHGELATRYRRPVELAASHAQDRSSSVVLFFGRAQGYKGLDVLAEAMVAVVDRVPDARLLVAGAGPSLDEVFPAAKTHPSWLRIARGRVDRDGVIAAFDEAAVVALPYRESSQSGVAALAAGFGRPVVATSVPGLRDIVEDGTSGVLVRPDSASDLADQLVGLLTDRDRLQTLGVGAFLAASGRLSWRSIARQTVELYHEALGAAVGSQHDGSRETGPGTGSFQ